MIPHLATGGICKGTSKLYVGAHFFRGRVPDRPAPISPAPTTPRVRRALQAVLAGPLGKDGQPDLAQGQRRWLKDEPLVDGTVVRVRLDRKVTSISLLLALGVCAESQKVLLAVHNMGSESEAARRALFDDLVKRGLGTLELVIGDGALGLEAPLGGPGSWFTRRMPTPRRHPCNLNAHSDDGHHPFRWIATTCSDRSQPCADG